MFQQNEEHLRAKHHERGKCRTRLPLKHTTGYRCMAT